MSRQNSAVSASVLKTVCFRFSSSSDDVSAWGFIADDLNKSILESSQLMKVKTRDAIQKQSIGLFRFQVPVISQG